MNNNLYRQTGAGKARFSPGLLDAMQSRHPAHFVSGAYKTYRKSSWPADRTATDQWSHPTDPEYTSILKSVPSLASPATSTDARKWLAKACNWCIDRHIDVVLESSCRNIEELMSLVSTFHADRYKVHVAVMAVPECLSLLGNMVRYYTDLSKAQPGDQTPGLTSRSVHYQTYGTTSPSFDSHIPKRRKMLYWHCGRRTPHSSWLHRQVERCW